MPTRGQLPAYVRFLRLAAAMSLVLALAAVVTIVNGGAAGKSQTLIVMAIVLGASALLGMALAALAYNRRNGWNDRRS